MIYEGNKWKKKYKYYLIPTFKEVVGPKTPNILKSQLQVGTPGFLVIKNIQNLSMS